MKQSEANLLMLRIQLSVQKLRSNLAETAERHGLTHEDMAEIHPWLFGQGNLLVAVTKALGKEQVEPLDLYNVCTIIHLLDKTGLIAGMLEMTLGGGSHIPCPDMNWLSGWESESEPKQEINKSVDY